MTLTARLGAFLLIVAFLNFVLCYASFRTDGPLMTTLCIGTICGGIGVYLMIKGRTPPSGEGRFRTMRNLMSRNQAEDEEIEE
jgi:hypothetical protein